MLIIFKCYLWPRLFFFFFKSQSYAFTCLLEILLAIWQLKLVSKSGYYFFLQNLISFVIPFLVNTMIHPVIQVILYSFQTLVTNLQWWPSTVDYISLSSLWVIVFLAFPLLLLKIGFCHFLAYLSKYGSNLSDWPLVSFLLSSSVTKANFSFIKPILILFSVPHSLSSV